MKNFETLKSGYMYRTNEGREVLVLKVDTQELPFFIASDGYLYSIYGNQISTDNVYLAEELHPSIVRPLPNISEVEKVQYALDTLESFLYSHGLHNVPREEIPLESFAFLKQILRTHLL
jgi:hypothetical protein